MMQNQPPGMGTQRIQTDAICVACGNVNPEGTLKCFSCGNDLAEQHRQRLAQGQAPVLQDSSAFNLRAIVSTLLIVLGLLFVLFVALNARRIENMMVEAQATSGPGRLFSGEEAGVFLDLATQLADSLATDEEIAAVLESPLPVTDITGRYLLLAGETEPATVATAIVRQEGDSVYFIARVRAGGEVRGKFPVPAGTLPHNMTARWEDTGLQYQGNIYACAGAAVLNEDGAIECFGQTELDSNNYKFTALRLP